MGRALDAGNLEHGVVRPQWRARWESRTADGASVDGSQEELHGQPRRPSSENQETAEDQSNAIALEAKQADARENASLAEKYALLRRTMRDRGDLRARLGLAGEGAAPHTSSGGRILDG